MPDLLLLALGLLVTTVVGVAVWTVGLIDAPEGTGAEPQDPDHDASRTD